MARANKRLPVTANTKELVDEQKPDGVPYDFYIRHAVKHAPPLSGDER